MTDTHKLPVERDILTMTDAELVVELRTGLFASAGFVRGRNPYAAHKMMRALDAFEEVSQRLLAASPTPANTERGEPPSLTAGERERAIEECIETAATRIRYYAKYQELNRNDADYKAGVEDTVVNLEKIVVEALRSLLADLTKEAT